MPAPGVPRALEAERSLPIVLNAANEVAVSSFLEGRLGFTHIPQVIAQTMDAHAPEPAATWRMSAGSTPGPGCTRPSWPKS